MTKTKLTATDSTGQTFTRTTARDYVFVVVTRADQKEVARYASELEKLRARRDELGTEGIERAAQEAERVWDEARKALKAYNVNLGMGLQRKASVLGRDADILRLIERCERDLLHAQELAASSKVTNVQWTSRRDLAEKAAAKARQHGAVEIVPVG